MGLSHSTHIQQHREGALVPWPVNMTESTIESCLVALSCPFASPIPWVGKEQASMPVGPTLLWSVPCNSVLRGYVTYSHPTEKGGLFHHRLHHIAPNGPCPEPLPRQSVATCWARVIVTVL